MRIAYPLSPPCSSLFLPLLGLLKRTGPSSDPAALTGDLPLLTVPAAYSSLLPSLKQLKIQGNIPCTPWLLAFLKKLLARELTESLWKPQQMT